MASSVESSPMRGAAEFELADLPEAHLLDEDGNDSEASTEVRKPRRSGGWVRKAGGVTLGLALASAGVVLTRKLAQEAPRGAGLRGQQGLVQFQQVTVASPATAKAENSTAKVTADDEAPAKTEEKKDEEKKEEKKECKLARADAKPGLFCWSVMFPGDVALLTSQLTGKAGMFACNDYLVISPEDKVIGKDECGEEVRTVKENLPAVKKGHYGVDAMTSSWLNVPIFLVCWDTVIKSGKVWEQDFTVKLDPDAVFFPDRLAAFLEPHKGKAIFTTDCRFWGGDQVGKLFGAIEVLSKQAIGSYKGNKDTCKNLGWQGWGEDMWMQECMNALKVPAVGMFDQVSDGTCPLGGYADCGQNKVVFHPQKDAGAWWECWKKSAGK